MGADETLLITIDPSGVVTGVRVAATSLADLKAAAASGQGGVDALQGAMDKMAGGSAAVNASLGQTSAAVRGMSASATEAAAILAALKSGQLDLSASGGALTVSAEGVAAALGKTGVAANGAAAGAANATAATTALNTELVATGGAAASASGGLSQIESIAARMAVRFALLGIAAGLVEIAKSSAEAATQFDWSLTKINTLVGVSKDQTDQWRGALQQLAVETGVAPKELADAMFVVTSNGFRGAEAMDVLTASAKASAVGLGDVTVVTRAVVGAVAAYGSANLSASQATDVLIATAREGNVKVDQMAGAFARVTPLASAMGISFADVGGYMATMTRLGANADVAMDALRAMLANIEKPGAAAQKALASVGLSAQGLRTELADKGLVATMMTLVDAFKGNDEALAHVIPNIRALTGFLAVAKSQGQEFVDITDRIHDSLGATDTAFGQIGDKPQHIFEQLAAAADVARIAVGDALMPALVDVAKRLTEWLLDGDRAAEMGRALGTALHDLAGVVSFLNDNWTGLKLLMEAWIALKVVSTLNTWVDALGKLTGAAATAAERTAALNAIPFASTVNGWGNSVGGFLPKLASLIGGVGTIAVILGTLTWKGLDMLIDRFKELTQEETQFEVGLGKLQGNKALFDTLQGAVNTGSPVSAAVYAPAEAAYNKLGNELDALIKKRGQLEKAAADEAAMANNAALAEVGGTTAADGGAKRQLDDVNALIKSKQLEQAADDGILRKAEALGVVYDDMGKKLKTVGDNTADTGAKTEQYAASVSQLLEKMADQASEQQTLADAAGVSTQALQDARREVAMDKAEYEVINLAIKDHIIASVDDTTAIQKDIQAARDHAGVLFDNTARLKENESALSSLTRTTKSYDDTLVDINEKQALLNAQNNNQWELYTQLNDLYGAMNKARSEGLSFFSPEFAARVAEIQQDRELGEQIKGNIDVRQANQKEMDKEIEKFGQWATAVAGAAAKAKKALNDAEIQAVLAGITKSLDTVANSLVDVLTGTQVSVKKILDQILKDWVDTIIKIEEKKLILSIETQVNGQSGSGGNNSGILNIIGKIFGGGSGGGSGFLPAGGALDQGMGSSSFGSFMDEFNGAGSFSLTDTATTAGSAYGAAADGAILDSAASGGSAYGTAAASAFNAGTATTAGSSGTSGLAGAAANFWPFAAVLIAGAISAALRNRAIQNTYEDSATVGVRGPNGQIGFSTGLGDQTQQGAQAASAISAYLNQLEQLTGGIIDALPGIVIRIRNDGKKFEAVVGGALVGNYDSLAQATQAAILAALQGATWKNLPKTIADYLKTAASQGTDPNQILADVKTLKGIDDAYQQAIAGAGASIATSMQTLFDAFQSAEQSIASMVQQGLLNAADASKLNFENDQTLAIGLQQQYDALTGKKQTDAQIKQEEADAYNAKLIMMRAQVALDAQEILDELNKLEAQKIYVGGQAVLTGGMATLAGGMLGIAKDFGEGVVAVLTPLEQALQGEYTNLINLEHELNNDPLLKPGDIKLNTSGGGNSTLKDLKTMIDAVNQSVRESTMTSLGVTIDQINVKWDAEVLLLGKNKKAIEEANAAREREIELALKQAAATSKTDVQNFLYGSNSVASQLAGVDTTSQGLIATLRELHKEGEISTQTLHQTAAEIRAAAEAQKAAILATFQQSIQAFLNPGNTLAQTINGLATTAQGLITNLQSLGAAGLMTAAQVQQATDEINKSLQQQQQQAVVDSTNTLLDSLYQYLGDSHDDAILKYQMEVASLELQRQQIYDEMVLLGMSTDVITNVIDPLIQKVIAAGPQFSSSVSSAAASASSIASSFAAALQSVRDLVFQLETGSLSALTPEQQFEYAQNVFTQAAQAAQGGDLTALQQLPDDAKAYLTAAQTWLGSTLGYEQIFNQVIALLTAIGGSPTNAAPGGTSSSDQSGAWYLVNGIPEWITGNPPPGAILTNVGLPAPPPAAPPVTPPPVTGGPGGGAPGGPGGSIGNPTTTPPGSLGTSSNPFFANILNFPSGAASSNAFSAASALSTPANLGPNLLRFSNAPLPVTVVATAASQPAPTSDPALLEEIQGLRRDLNAGLGKLNTTTENGNRAAGSIKAAVARVSTVALQGRR